MDHDREREWSGPCRQTEIAKLFRCGPVRNAHVCGLRREFVDISGPKEGLLRGRCSRLPEDGGNRRGGQKSSSRHPLNLTQSADPVLINGGGRRASTV